MDEAANQDRDARPNDDSNGITLLFFVVWVHSAYYAINRNTLPKFSMANQTFDR
jgi:hypothetical protein